MNWGFPTQVKGKTKTLIKNVTNARNIESPFWKGAASNPARRCLVPFTQFAEPRPGKDAEGLPAQWWFTINDQLIPCFAGLWRPTESGPAFAFLTTRSEEHTSELQSLMRNSYAVFCLKKKKHHTIIQHDD